MPIEPCVIADLNTVPEGWNEPDGRGVVGWQTVLSSNVTPTEALTAGIATLQPGGFLALHRHAPAEIYHIIEGAATVTLNGVAHGVTRGDTVFIPAMAEHGIRNDSAAATRFFYVFPTDTFEGIDYIFS